MGELTLGEGIKFDGGVYLWRFPRSEVMSKFSASGGTPPIRPSRENPGNSDLETKKNRSGFSRKTLVCPKMFS